MNHKLSLLFLFFIIVSTSALVAQNTLIKYNGTSIPAAKIIIETNQIKYSDSTQDTLLHVVARNEIGAILRADGTIEVVYNQEPAEVFSSKKYKPLPTDSIRFGWNRKNTIGIDFLSLLTGAGCVWYERTFAKGYLGVQVPLYVGYRASLVPSAPLQVLAMSIQDVKDFGVATGLRMNVLPLRKKEITPIFGVSSLMSVSTNFIYVPSPTRYYGSDKQCNYIAVTNMGHVGLQYRPVKWFALRFELGAGYAYNFYTSIKGALRRSDVVFNGGLSTAFRF
jgi:hypothetical protein